MDLMFTGAINEDFLKPLGLDLLLKNKQSILYLEGKSTKGHKEDAIKIDYAKEILKTLWQFTFRNRLAQRGVSPAVHCLHNSLLFLSLLFFFRLLLLLLLLTHIC